MKAENPDSFDPKIIPWETTPEEWVSYEIPRHGRVWVECALIKKMQEAKVLTRESIDSTHDMFTAIGSKITVPSDRSDSDDHVQSFTFVGYPIEVRVGTFSGKSFMFSPRPEFGWNAEQN